MVVILFSSRPHSFDGSILGGIKITEEDAESAGLPEKSNGIRGHMHVTSHIKHWRWCWAVGHVIPQQPNGTTYVQPETKIQCLMACGAQLSSPQAAAPTPLPWAARASSSRRCLWWCSPRPCQASLLTRQVPLPCAGAVEICTSWRGSNREKLWRIQASMCGGDED